MRKNKTEERIVRLNRVMGLVSAPSPPSTTRGRQHRKTHGGGRYSVIHVHVPILTSSSRPAREIVSWWASCGRIGQNYGDPARHKGSVRCCRYLISLSIVWARFRMNLARPISTGLNFVIREARWNRNFYLY